MSDTDLPTRVAVLERDMHHIGEALDRIDRRLDRMEGRIDQLGTQLGGRIDSNFHWILGTMMLVFGGLLLTMAKGFKWL